ncbi:Zinc finger protein 687, partial [Dryobates pubescens]
CERSFCSAPSLRRHVRVNHEGIKRVYPCRYCTEGKRTFSSRLILERHIQVRHGIKVTDQAKSQEVVIARMGTGAAQVPGPGRPSGASGRAWHRLPREAVAAPSLEVFKARLDFQEHIPQHRTDDSSQQCRECGLCFTSQVSLNRHRFITHKKKKGAAEPEEPGPRSPLEGGAQPPADGKLSCKVCGRGFDSQLNLKTHFRTHGMAFIRARQNAS